MPFFKINNSELSRIAQNPSIQKYRFSNEFGNTLNEREIAFTTFKAIDQTTIPHIYPDILAPGTDLMTTVIKQPMLYNFISNQDGAVIYFAGAIG